MNFELQNLVCREISDYKKSNRELPFNIIKCIWNYNKSNIDKILLDKVTKRGEELASKVHKGAANNSTKSRPTNRIKSNAIAGVLAEYCWRVFLNSISLETLVLETPFKDAANQIDLNIIGTEKKIEVRSSFPRNGIPFAICSPNYQFDILGPYSNNYKPEEIQKDYYLRTLYHVPTPISFLEEYKKDGFVTYLTGGATWQMMIDNKVAIDKSLVPEDDITETEVETMYRVVPFSKALDCADVFKLIKKERD